MNVRVFDSVRLASSSSWKLAGERPPPAVKREVLRVVRQRVLDDVIWPRLRFVNVQVTVSPAATAMFETGLPSLQVALGLVPAAGTVSDTE